MIWFWVLIWVEVVGSDGSGNGCGRWWLVAVSVAGGGWWQWVWPMVAGGSECGRWWLVAVNVAVVVGFVFAVVF